MGQRATALLCVTLSAALMVRCSLSVSPSDYIGGGGKGDAGSGGDGANNPDSPTTADGGPGGGHVMMIGGYRNALDAGPDSGLGGASLGYVWVAPLDPASGSIGAWAPTWPLAVAGGMGVQTFGPILGGAQYGPVDDNGNGRNVFQWANFGSGGLTGPWQVALVDTWEPVDDCAGPQFFGNSVDCYGGQVPVGDAGARATVTDIWQATLDPVAHTLSPWTRLGATLALDRRHEGLATFGSYVYLTGGCASNTGDAQADVQWAQVDATGAPTGTFTMASPLSLDGTTAYPMCSPGANVYKNFLYVWGGSDASGNPATAILLSVLDPTTGAPGPFKKASDLPTPLNGFQLFATASHLYVVGSPLVGSPADAVYSIAINADGTLDLQHGWSSATANPPLPDEQQYPGVFLY